MRRSLAFAAVSAILALEAEPARAAVSGTWSGSVTVTTQCRPGVSRTDSSPVSLSVNEQGGRVTGVISIVEIVVAQDCSIEEQNGWRLPLAGSVSGNSMTASFLGPFESGPANIPIRATVSGSSMSVTFGLGDTSGTGTLTQTSSSSQDSRFEGSWRGVYTARTTGAGCPTLVYSGTAEGSLYHAGSTFAGSLTLSQDKHYDSWRKPPCTPHVKDVAFLVSGTATGNSASGQMVEMRRESAASGPRIPVPVSFTISGDSLSGSGGQGETSATIMLTRRSAATAPIITAFTGDQERVTAGASVALAWDAFDATSVTIDGLGTFGATGSATVTPTATTTYRLTALRDDQTSTLTTTIVVPVGPRRRATRR